MKLDRELVTLFKFSDHIKFLYERGLFKITFVKTSKIKDVPSTAITQQCFGDFVFLDSSLETKIDFCEIELTFTNLDWKFQTFAAYLKPGKEVEFLWELDTATTLESLEKGIHVDTLSAIVYEGKEHQQHFTLAVHTGKESSFSRMIIPETSNNEEALVRFLTTATDS